MFLNMILVTCKCANSRGNCFLLLVVLGSRIVKVISGRTLVAICLGCEKQAKIIKLTHSQGRFCNILQGGVLQLHFLFSFVVYEFADSTIWNRYGKPETSPVNNCIAVLYVSMLSKVQETEASCCTAFYSPILWKVKYCSAKSVNIGGSCKKIDSIWLFAYVHVRQPAGKLSSTWEIVVPFHVWLFFSRQYYIMWYSIKIF